MPLTRKRQRITPVPPGTVELGHFRIRDPNSGAYGLTAYGHAYNSWLNNHPFTWGEYTEDQLHGRPPYRTGGPFKNVKVVSCRPMVAVSASGVYHRPDGRKTYFGGFSNPPESAFAVGNDLVVTPSSMTLASASWLFPPMTGLGDRAWSATKPHIQKASGYVFLKESREIPLMLRTSAQGLSQEWEKVRSTFGGRRATVEAMEMTPKKAANHFLNHEFGWVPFISDLKAFHAAFQRMDEHITRLSRQNGKAVRRKIPLFKENKTTLIASGNGTKVFPNTVFDYDPEANWSKSWYVGTGATWELYDVLTDESTATGKFTFYLPEFDRNLPDYTGVMKTLRRRLDIYGLRVNPSNVYKATPWTWAADWVSNVGDHVDNITDTLFDGISCEYCFVTRHTRRIRRFIQRLPFASGTVVLQFDREVDTKQRIGARSPYGFNLDWTNLSARQIAIAAALGITRHGGSWQL